MKLAAIASVLEELAPLRYAEGWDNVGLIVGEPTAEIERVLVTVDYTSAVANEAREQKANLVVAYHPPMFAPVKRVPYEALWADAVRRGIALYSMHTALDVAPQGTNDFLADVCGINAERRPLRPLVDRPELGLGRVGAISPAILSAVVDRVKMGLGLSHVMVSGDLSAPIESVAVAAGAGGELLGDARRAGAGLFVTGEIRHHDALASNMAVIMTLHSNSERAAVRAFAARLAARLPDVAVAASARDADPFVIV